MHASLGGQPGWHGRPDGGETTIEVFTAVREQLGLKLESSKALFDTLIIDRLERPTEN